MSECEEYVEMLKSIQANGRDAGRASVGVRRGGEGDLMDRCGMGFNQHEAR